MNKFKIAELIQELNDRLEEIERRFKIRVDRNWEKERLWIDNSKLALGIEEQSSGETK